MIVLKQAPVALLTLPQRFLRLQSRSDVRKKRNDARNISFRVPVRDLVCLDPLLFISDKRFNNVSFRNTGLNDLFVIAPVSLSSLKTPIIL